MTPIFKQGKLVLSGCLVVNGQDEVLLLYKTEHNHYETPGGKVEAEECANPSEPTLEDLAHTAERETHEELGEDLHLSELVYFGAAEFIIPGGQRGIAHKFLTRILLGQPSIREPEKFLKLEYLPLKDLENYPLSPDLQQLAPRLRTLSTP